nr:hypothetical protein [Legionella quateirensis]
MSLQEASALFSQDEPFGDKPYRQNIKPCCNKA